MDNRILLITFGVLSVFISQVRGQCSFQPPYFISETDSAGTVIFNISKATGANATFGVVDTDVPPNTAFKQDLRNCLLLTNYNSSFTLENTKPLDLEEFMLDHRKDITTVNLKVTCDGQETDVFISVQPVNEFTPVFQQSPYNLSLPESTNVGAIVFKLKPRVHDQDVGGVQNFIFRINPYNIKDFDGIDYFSIPASSQGNISLFRRLDYDAPDSRNTYRLNVSVADGQSGDSKTAYTDVNIYVTDVDDQDPYFNFPNCPKPCPAPPFQSTIRLDYTGPLQVIPNPLRATDDDTLGTRLLYSIKSGNQYNMFEINQLTGDVTQKTSVNALNLPDTYFRLVIEVRKNLTNVDLSSIAVLTVHVWERMSNDSGFPEPPVGESKEDSSSGSSLLIPIIVIGVLLAAVIIALVVVIIKHRREMAVTPVDDKSEPQTEEEDLPTDGEEYNAQTDSNEKLVFGNKTTLGIMTDQFPDTSGEKANRLPPLPMRDTATETTEGNKKKSRRRNKKKEPEIFDGTREYNMGLDPEFFDSTDKSKVKRSQRSRKGDSALPIQVPNDNPADQDKLYQ